MRQQIYSLVVELPPGSTACYLLHASHITIGRGQDNMVVVQEPTVSGRHCEIRQRDGRVEIKDLGSSNGTTLNGDKLGRDAVQLRHGDVLTFGFSAKARFAKVIEIKEVAPDYPRTIVPEERPASPPRRQPEPERQHQREREPEKKVVKIGKEEPPDDYEEDGAEEYEPTINPVAAAMAKAGKFMR